ncbi:PilN domain-containing protein [Priestia koreensis]|uniref:PilN domain-containing protein n=1 Tax=Priestia koreensis TaxID=284581 RepID=UPI001F56232B|nr:hypothetical protein [Priestia koreensis]UNL84356.1 hypothetical protein IE339_19780 [Priestia koreensis]
MLVEINLLPKKQAKNAALILVLAIILVIVAAGSTFLVWKQTTLQESVNELDRQTEALQEERATKQKPETVATENKSVQQLQTTVDWVKQYPVETMPVLKEIAKLLPERGFLEQFTYASDGKVSLTIQFDTNRDAAFYLSQLESSKLITDARILTVQAGVIVETYLDGSTSQSIGENNTVNATDTDQAPRYKATYEVTINKDEVKKAAEKEGDS